MVLPLINVIFFRSLFQRRNILLKVIKIVQTCRLSSGQMAQPTRPRTLGS